MVNTTGTADQTLNKTLKTHDSKKDLKPPPPEGKKHSAGPLTPVDSPRTAIEKIIQGKSPGLAKNEGGVARS
jgi:hypothetical protein